MPFLFRGSRILIWSSCPHSISNSLPSVQKKCPLPHFYVLSNFHGNLPPKLSYGCPLLGIQISFFFFDFLKVIYFTWRLITFQYCIVFAIHWHESTMGVEFNLSCSATLKHSYITTVSISFIVLNFSHLIHFIFVFITPVLTPQRLWAPPRVKCHKSRAYCLFSSLCPPNT